MPYLLLKYVHVLAAMLFLGTGLGSAFFKFRADRSGNLAVTAWCQRQVVLADWLFTTQSALLLPLSAVGLVRALGLSWSSPWLLAGLSGYVVSGLLWLPAVWLQVLMRRLADQALATGQPLSPSFYRYARAWTVLGVPSFLVALGTVWVMVAKHAAL